MRSNPGNTLARPMPESAVQDPAVQAMLQAPAEHLLLQNGSLEVASAPHVIGEASSGAVTEENKSDGRQPAQADLEVAAPSRVEAEPQTPEPSSSIRDLSRLTLRKIMNTENPEELPEAFGAGKISAEERSSWLAKLKVRAEAEEARRNMPGERGGSFKTLDEINSVKATSAVVPTTHVPAPKPEQGLAERLDSPKDNGQTHAQEKASTWPSNDPDSKNSHDIPGALAETSKGSTAEEAKRYDAKYAALPENEIMDLGYRISGLEDNSAIRGMSSEEQKALAHAYTRTVASLEAEYANTDPAWIMHWKENEHVKPLPRGYQALLDKHAKQAEIELTERYRNMTSQDLIKMADEGADIRSSVEQGIFKAQLDRAQNEARAYIAGASPQDIIKSYESAMADPEASKGMYTSLLAEQYDAAQKVVANWQAKYQNMSDQAIIGLSEKRIKEMPQGEFDIYNVERQKAVEHQKNLLATENQAIHQKYNQMDTAGIMRAADEAFAGKMSDTEFDIFSDKYRAALNNMHLQLSSMQPKQIVEIYEQFQNGTPDSPKNEGLLKAMQPLYERAKTREQVYESYRKMDEQGRGNFHNGLDYLTTEELKQMQDYAHGPKLAAEHRKKYDRSAKHRDKFTAIVARGRKYPWSHLDKKIATSAPGNADYYRKLLEASPNTTDTQLLTKDQLRTLEHELKNRERHQQRRPRAQGKRRGQPEGLRPFYP